MNRVTETQMKKEQAAQFLGVSVRTLDNYTQKGRIKPTFINSPNSRPVADFAETELQKLKDEIAETKGVSATVHEVVSAAPPTQKSQPVSATQLAVASKNEGPVSATSYNLAGTDLAALIEMAAQGRGEVVRVAEKTILTFAEASAFTGIPEKRLREAAKTGDLPTSKTLGRAQKLRRVDLDKWVDNQFA